MSAGGDEVNYPDVEFIDDETNVQDHEPLDYCIMNITRDLQEAVREDSIAEELGLVCSDPENYVSDYVEEIEYKFDEFEGFKNRIKKFEQGLKIFEMDSKDSFMKDFYFAILYAASYALLNEKEDFDFHQDKYRLVEVFGQDFSDKLEAKKESLRLDLSLSTLETHCHLINDLLMSKTLFLRVYRLRKKFRYLIKKVPQNKNIFQKYLSVCVEEHFNGFQIVRRITENERKQFFKPIDIMYRPVSKINQTINCYFSKSMRKAYRAVRERERGNEMTTADQCYACNKFFVKRNPWKSI